MGIRWAPHLLRNVFLYQVSRHPNMYPLSSYSGSAPIHIVVTASIVSLSFDYHIHIVLSVELVSDQN